MHSAAEGYQVQPWITKRRSHGNGLGECGCGVTRQSCEEGQGTGSCPIKQGTVRANAIERKIKVEAAAATVNAAQPESWPHCANVNRRVILPDHLGNSPELQKIFDTQRKCYILVRGNKEGNLVNHMALQSSVHQAGLDSSQDPVWWRLRKSRQDGEPSSSKPDRSIFRDRDKPKLSSIHRRRVANATTADRRLLRSSPIHAQNLMGVGFMYPESGSAEQHAQAEAEVREILTEFQSSYAEEQMQLLASDARLLHAILSDAIANITDSMPDLHNTTAAAEAPVRLLTAMSGNFCLVSVGPMPLT